MVKWRAEFELGRRGRSTMWALIICIALACLTAAVLFLTLPGALASPKTYDDDYGIMIDAGSSGSRIFLYTWRHRNSSQTPVVRALIDPKTNTSLVMKILPGLQAYQNNITGAGLSLDSLIQFAKSNLPQDRWADTPATAGLRKLPTNVSDALIASVRTYLRISPFKYKDAWVRLIPGSEEAINDWVTVNSLAGTLGGAANDTIGIVEVGGASLQVAFIPATPPPASQTWVVKMNGQHYSVYAVSYLYFGLTEAKYRLNSSLWDANNASEENPCFLSGYTEHVQATTDDGTTEDYQLVGTGDFDACVASSIPLLNLTAPCASPPCLFSGVHQPPMRGYFHGIDNFAKALVFYNLLGNYSSEDLAAAGRNFCAMDWANASAKWPSTPAPLKDYCFMAAYLYAILSQGIKIAPDDHTTFDYSMYINGTEVSWTTGAITLQVSALPWDKPNWFADPKHLLAVTLPPIFVLCVALSLVWLCRLRKSEIERLGYERVDEQR